MKVRRLECWVFRCPIETPVRTSFGMMTSRPAVFLRVSAQDGAWGWGEVFCNFPQVGAEHRANLVESVFAPLLEGTASDDLPAARERLEAGVRRLVIQCGEPGPFSQVAAAIDQALWDMTARRQGIPLWKLLGGTSAGNRVRIYASGLGPARVAEEALRQHEAGYRAFKFKVGFGARQDVAAFREIRDALGDEAVVMVDANQAWSPAEAVARIAELAPYRPLWVEEPIPADEPFPAWEALARESSVPLAAGENLRGIDEFRRILERGIIAFVQPDVAKWGGISGCREVALEARRYGAQFCPHWLGGGIGLAASLHLRAALGPEGYAEVDANPNPLREELFEPSPVEGWVTLGDAPGIGLEPDLGRLERFCTGRRISP
jgi:L-alanine-DL-glutamate epimerase-like enolase superfamily enzyme